MTINPLDMGVTPLDNNTVLVGSPRFAMDEISKGDRSAGRHPGQDIEHNREKDPDDPSVMRIQNNFEFLPVSPGNRTSVYTDDFTAKTP